MRTVNPDKESPDDHVTKRVMIVAKAGEFKIKVIERTRVGITRLPRGPIRHGKVRCRHRLPDQ